MGDILGGAAGLLVVAEHLPAVGQRMTTGELEPANPGIQGIDEAVDPAAQFAGLVGYQPAGIQPLAQIAFALGDIADDRGHAADSAGQSPGGAPAAPHGGGHDAGNQATTGDGGAEPRPTED